MDIVTQGLSLFQIAEHTKADEKKEPLLSSEKDMEGNQCAKRFKGADGVSDKLVHLSLNEQQQGFTATDACRTVMGASAVCAGAALSTLAVAGGAAAAGVAGACLLGVGLAATCMPAACLAGASVEQQPQLEGANMPANDPHMTAARQQSLSLKEQLQAQYPATAALPLGTAAKLGPVMLELRHGEEAVIATEELLAAGAVSNDALLAQQAGIFEQYEVEHQSCDSGASCGKSQWLHQKTRPTVPLKLSDISGSIFVTTQAGTVSNISTTERRVQLRQRAGTKCTVGWDDLAKLFHLNINEAARQLGTTSVGLKVACRELGIARWPRRLLNSLDIMIAQLQEYRALQAEEVEPLLAELLQCRAQIMAYSTTQFSQGLLVLRMRLMSARFQARRSDSRRASRKRGGSE